MARSKHYYEKYSRPPLKMQFQAGMKAFNSNKQWLRKLRNGKTIVVTANPYPLDTMQSKEWQRGYNTAYAENLKRLSI